jgi:predicted secreted protein
MKKVLATAAILSVISLVGINTASAHNGRYYNNNTYGYCGSYNSDYTTSTKEDFAAIEKFRNESSTIRKEIVVKRSELNALLHNDNPNEEKVAKLTGELYDLRSELAEKAEKTGVRSRYAYDHGPGMMGIYGWGRGGHMMGW